MGSDISPTRASRSIEIHPLWQECIKASGDGSTLQPPYGAGKLAAGEKAGRNVGGAPYKLLKGFGRAGLPGSGTRASESEARNDGTLHENPVALRQGPP